MMRTFCGATFYASLLIVQNTSLLEHETWNTKYLWLAVLLPLPSASNRCVPVFLHQDPSLLTCIHNITTWTGAEEKGNNDMHLYKLSNCNLQHDIRVKFPSVTRCPLQLLTTCRRGSVVTSVTSGMIWSVSCGTSSHTWHVTASWPVQWQCHGRAQGRGPPPHLRPVPLPLLRRHQAAGHCQVRTEARIVAVGPKYLK